MTRHEFLQTSLSLAALAAAPAVAAPPKMAVKFYCPLWGNTLPPEAFAKRAREAGYDGVELSIWPLGDRRAKDALIGAIREQGLEIIVQQWQSGTESQVDKHLALLEAVLRDAAAVRPRFINSQTGKDWYPFEQNVRIIERCLALERDLGVPIYHETHRGKFNFHALVTLPYLDRFPDLKMTADLSHWCNVSESLLADQQALMARALPHFRHIHARVGHAEGPQVNDPRAPEWKTALDAHLGWWDAIVQRRAAAGDRELTIAPEFGPPTYLPTLPYTQQPVADQWEINRFMMNLLRKRYET
jgi:sugar phosphate isomerase/epimerase